MERQQACFDKERESASSGKPKAADRVSSVTHKSRLNREQAKGWFLHDVQEREGHPKGSLVRETIWNCRQGVGGENIKNCKRHISMVLKRIGEGATRVFCHENAKWWKGREGGKRQTESERHEKEARLAVKSSESVKTLPSTGLKTSYVLQFWQKILLWLCGNKWEVANF